MKKLAQPIEPQLMIRILVAIIIILAYLAGYYHSAWKIEKQKNKVNCEARESTLGYKKLEMQYIGAVVKK